MSVKITRKNKEAWEFTQMFEDTMKDIPAGNILEFVSDAKHYKSAQMLQWAIVISATFLKNQFQDKWVFEEPTAEEAESAGVILVKLAKAMRERLA